MGSVAGKRLVIQSGNRKIVVNAKCALGLTESSQIA